MEQLTGAGIASIVVLAYVLLLEAVTAAIVMLGQFLVLQIRALRLLVEPPAMPPSVPVPTPIPEPAGDHEVVIGGGIRKWD
jgi:hypothetical protein